MADLEEMGFIASPHTSAGRVPTSRGYRVFVDSLLTIKPLGESDLGQLEGNLHPDHPQRAISQASQLLSELTRFAGVVMAPRRRSAAFRHIEFLCLSEKRVLLIIVTPEGDVQNRILVTDKRVHARRADDGGELPEPALRRAQLRRHPPPRSTTSCGSCART